MGKKGRGRNLRAFNSFSLGDISKSQKKFDLRWKQFIERARLKADEENIDVWSCDASGSEIVLDSDECLDPIAPVFLNECKAKRNSLTKDPERLLKIENDFKHFTSPIRLERLRDSGKSKRDSVEWVFKNDSGKKGRLKNKTGSSDSSSGRFRDPTTPERDTSKSEHPRRNVDEIDLDRSQRRAFTLASLKRPRKKPVRSAPTSPNSFGALFRKRQEEETKRKKATDRKREVQALVENARMITQEPCRGHKRAQSAKRYSFHFSLQSKMESSDTSDMTRKGSIEDLQRQRKSTALPKANQKRPIHTSHSRLDDTYFPDMNPVLERPASKGKKLRTRYEVTPTSSTASVSVSVEEFTDDVLNFEPEVKKKKYETGIFE